MGVLQAEEPSRNLWGPCGGGYGCPTAWEGPWGSYRAEGGLGMARGEPIGVWRGLGEALKCEGRLVGDPGSIGGPYRGWGGIFGGCIRAGGGL